MHVVTLITNLTICWCRDYILLYCWGEISVSLAESRVVIVCMDIEQNRLKEMAS